MPRITAISTGPATHLDHLGVLAALLDIPLIVTDAQNFQLCKHYYPQVRAHLINHQDLTLEFLAANFDVILGTGKFWAMEFLASFELLQKKRMRVVFCPHGNSEKGASFSTHPIQDIVLFYGPQMQELLAKTGQQTSALIRTGNFRYAFYLSQRAFYDTMVEKEIFSRLQSDKKTILYAPTWPDAENPTHFFETCSAILKELAPFYNLIIKPHPLLEEAQPAHFYYLEEQCQNLDRVVFLKDFPPIYPLLSKVDIYLGDFSSVGYDFLAFDRPMYFFHASKQTLLSRCGLEAPSRDLKRFLDETLTKNQHVSERQKLYAFAFGEPRNIEEIKQELIQEVEEPSYS